MKISVQNELIEILKTIISYNKDEKYWAEHESDDMFQSTNYIAGFDTTENAFTFSYYDEDENEYWFQLSIEDIKKILSNKINEIELRKVS